MVYFKLFATFIKKERKELGHETGRVVPHQSSSDKKFVKSNRTFMSTASLYACRNNISTIMVII